MLRVIHVSGDTLRYTAAALSLLAFARFPSYQSIYNIVEDLKAEILSSVVRPDLGVRTYPDSPHDLPIELYSAAYNNEPPILKAKEKATEAQAWTIVALLVPA